MPIDQHRLKLFNEHLERVTKGRPCPECDSNNWAVDGPLFLAPENEHHNFGYRPSVAPIFPNLGRMPLMLVICQTCFYVKPFAWWPILNASEPMTGMGPIVIEEDGNG